MSRFLGILVLVWCAVGALAASGTLLITPYPTIALADSRSTVNITVEVRDNTGRLVPDGTEVLFGTTLGTLRDTIVQTRSGFARTMLIAGAEPGIAKVTASCFQYQSNSSLDYEFVKDKAMLNSMKDFIEVWSPKRIRYIPDLKVLETAAKNRGVRLEFRDVQLEADELQIKVPSYEARAKNVVLKVYGKSHTFQELYFVLNRKQGYGLGTGDEKYTVLVGAYPYVRGITKTRRRTIVQEISGDQLSQPKNQVPAAVFQWEDLSYGASEILSSHAVVYPARELMLQRAEIEVQGQRLMSVPYYRIPIYADVPVLGDRVLNMTGSQVSLNYPLYLNLRPGFNSLLRFRTGTAYTGGGGVGGGSFMDYEMNWSKGTKSDGGLTFANLLRKDMGAAARQFLRLDDRTSIAFQAQLPTRDSFFSGMQFNHQIGRLNLNYSGNYGRSLRGPQYSNSFQLLALENMPVQLKGTPFQFTYGLTAQENKYTSNAVKSRQSLIGLRTRVNSASLPISKTASIMTSASVTRRLSSNSGNGLAVQANLSLNSRLGRNASTFLHYDFLDDDFVSRDTGRHKIGGSLNFDKGAVSLSIFGNKSLDTNRHNVTTNASYSLSQLWRLSGYYSRDVYLSGHFDEATMMLGYRVGGSREFGISYSSRTKRFGIEVLGAAF